MFKRGWGDLRPIGLAVSLIIAAGAAYWLYEGASSKQMEYEHTAKKRADYYAKRSDILIRDECAALAPYKQAICISEEREAARKGQRDEYDLEAQRVTATWTAHMGMAAIIGMAASLTGVGLIFVTFRETQKAADAARVNKEAYIWNERAWLKFENWPNNGIPVNKKGHQPYVSLRNSGKSAAKITSVTAFLADCEWARDGTKEKWSIASGLIQSGAQGIAYGRAVSMEIGEIKRFIVCIEYEILGGSVEKLECEFSLSREDEDSGIRVHSMLVYASR